MLSNYKDISEDEYRSFSFKIKEKTGSGIIAVVMVGSGGQDFFDQFLKEPFGYSGIIYSPSLIEQRARKDEEGYRHSWLESDINPSLKKAIIVERTVESGKSLLSADVYLLDKILEDSKKAIREGKKEGYLDIDVIYNLTATDYADLGHFQITGKNIYGKRDGRSVFIEMLGEKFPGKYTKLLYKNNELKIRNKAFKDIFSRVSDMPHMRLREEEYKDEKTEDRREFIKDITTGLAALAGQAVIKKK